MESFKFIVFIGFWEKILRSFNAASMELQSPKLDLSAAWRQVVCKANFNIFVITISQYFFSETSSAKLLHQNFFSETSSSKLLQWNFFKDTSSTKHLQQNFYSETSSAIFKGDYTDTGAKRFPLMLMGGWAEGLACADPLARTPLGDSGIHWYFLFLSLWAHYSACCCCC